MTYNDYPESTDGYEYDEAGRSTAIRPSHIAILGVPFDGGTLGEKVGQRLAPLAIRNLEALSTMLSAYNDDVDGEQVSVVDCGDVQLDRASSAGAAHDLIEERARAIKPNTSMLLAVGGDHSITPWLMKGALLEQLYLDDTLKPVVIHLDAHTDTWAHEEYEEYGTANHASWVRWVLENNWAHEVHQFGVRGFAPDEKDLYGKPLFRHQLPPEESFTRAMQVISTAGRPVYLTVDLDVCDPSFAPGVVAPEPGGWTSLQLMNFITSIVSSGAVKGMDIVECCPPQDYADLTVRLAHRCIAASIIGFSWYLKGVRDVAALRQIRMSGEDEPASSLEGEAVLDANTNVTLPTEGDEIEELDMDTDDIIEGGMATRSTKAVKKAGRGAKKVGRGTKKAAKGAKKATKTAKKATKGAKKATKAAKKTVKKATKTAAKTTRAATKPAAKTAKKAATKAVKKVGKRG